MYVGLARITCTDWCCRALALSQRRRRTRANTVPGRSVHSQIDRQSSIILPATPERRTRKSMSRRSGQSGCIQKDGNWFVVRFWKDVANQERRQRVREKICPISGPGKLSASERERKAKEIIAASGADTVDHFEKVVRSNHGVTFREQAIIWLNQMKNRKRKPVAPSTVDNWESALGNWLNPNIGDMPLDAVNNLAMKDLVAKMVASGELGPKSIGNYTQVVKAVVRIGGQ